MPRSSPDGWNAWRRSARTIRTLTTRAAGPRRAGGCRCASPSPRPCSGRIAKESDVRLGSVLAWAGCQIFSVTGRIEEVARRLGMRSIDRAAGFIGWEWVGGQDAEA